MKSILKIVLLVNVILCFASTKTYSQLYWNNSVSFAGNSSSYVAVPNSSSININGSFSIEAWINPATLAGASKGIISKGGSLGTALIYAIRLNTSGRISVVTNGATRLTSKVTGIVPLNSWTHICATFNSSSNLFSIYINGLADTSATVAGAIPNLNTDSLFIGVSGASTPFNGQLDEVRLWNKSLSPSEVSNFMRTSLGASSGIYSGLVMSIAFQGENTSVNDFKDMSGNNNNAFNRNIVFASPINNLAGGNLFRPHQTISQNECIELDGTDDYLAGKDTSVINCDTAITLEAWIYPRSTTGGRIITKGNNYALILATGNDFRALINNTTINSDLVLQSNQWSYLAFTYRANGDYVFYLNGKAIKSSSITPTNINTTADSIFVGGGSGSITDFNGYIDEVRITNAAKSQDQIYKLLYASLNIDNDPNIIQKNINYGFDGNTYDNIGDGGPRLVFRNNARFSHPGQIASQPVSPLNQFENREFSTGYYIKTSNKKIPSTGTSGVIADSLNVNLNIGVSDINFFVSINHTKSSDLDIVLIAPNGDSVKVFNNDSSISKDNNVITIFDDNADSINTNGRYASFYAQLKPLNSLNSVFAGDNTKGFWKIKIRDEANTNSGILYGWGLQINDLTIRPKNLNMSLLIQGFYDSTLNNLRPDTITANLFFSGLAATDKAVVQKDGKCYFSFNSSGSITNDKNFLLQINHRNSVETWGNQSFKFNFSENDFDFINPAGDVLGDNVILADNSPLRFAIYGGDINQDDVVDLNDIVPVFNSSANFTSGYTVTDVTGDNTVDLTDVVLVFNNANNFVSAVVP